MLLAGTPTGTVTTLPTNDTTPALSGTLTNDGSDNIDSVNVIVHGHMYAASSFNQTTWTLNNDVISPALAEGVYDVVLFIHDVGGETGTDSTTNELTIDTTPPADPTVAPDLQAASDTGVSNTDNITKNTSLTFDINTGGAPKFNFYIDGGKVASNQTGSTYTVNSQTQGTHTYAISAVDDAGNESAVGPTLSVTIDTTAPTAPGRVDLQDASDSGVSSTDNNTNDNTPTFDLTSTDTYFRFFVTNVQNGGDYLTGSSYTTTVLTDGPKLMTIKAVDAAGNISASSISLVVFIDTAAPVAPGAPDLQAASDSGVSSTDNITNNNTPTFNVGSTGTYFRFYVDGVQNGGDYLSGSSYTTTVLADVSGGQFLIKGVDTAGNVSASGTALAVTIDTTAPGAPGAPDLQAASDSGVSSTDNITNVTTPTFDVTSTDSYFRFYVDGVQNGGDYLSGSSYTTTALSDGSGKQVYIKAVDTAGNVSTNGTALSVTIDTVAPAAPGTPDLQAASDSGISSTDNITNITTPTFDVTSTDTYFRFYVDGIQNGGNYLSGGSYTTTALTDGGKSMTATAVDAAGNISAASTPLVVTIDTTVPAAPGAPDLQAGSDSGISSTDNITNIITPTFDVTSTDSYFRFFVDGIQNSGDYLSGSSYTTTALADVTSGSFLIKAVDVAGNVSASGTALTVTIDTTAPAAPGAPDLQAASDSGVSATDNITNDNTPTFDITSTDTYFRFYVDGV